MGEKKAKAPAPAKVIDPNIAAAAREAKFKKVENMVAK